MAEFQAPAPLLYITVSDSLILTEGGKDYTAYAIRILTHDPHFLERNSLVSRRFSEFRELRELLASRHRDLRIPALPSKCVLPCCRLKRKTIDKRARGIRTFIDGLMQVRELKTDVCLLHFLQSERTMAEIKIIGSPEVDPGEVSTLCSESTPLLSHLLSSST